MTWLASASTMFTPKIHRTRQRMSNVSIRVIWSAPSEENAIKIGSWENAACVNRQLTISSHCTAKQLVDARMKSFSATTFVRTSTISHFRTISSQTTTTTARRRDWRKICQRTLKWDTWREEEGWWEIFERSNGACMLTTTKNIVLSFLSLQFIDNRWYSRAHIQSLPIHRPLEFHQFSLSFVLRYDHTRAHVIQIFQQNIYMNLFLKLGWYSPRHVRKLIAECPQRNMGVLRRRYADPLKYASRGSTLNELTLDKLVSVMRRTGKKKENKQRKEMWVNVFIIFVQCQSKKEWSYSWSLRSTWSFFFESWVCSTTQFCLLLLSFYNTLVPSECLNR